MSTLRFTGKATAALALLAALAVITTAAGASLGPTVWEYVKLIVRGRHFRGIQADPFQLGGDFVIDGSGIVRFAHRGEEPG